MSKAAFKPINKLTAKDIMGVNLGMLAREKLKPSEKLELYVLMGSIRAMKTGQSTYGDWVKFIGDFTCKRLTDEQVLVSKECIVQEPLQSYIVDAVEDSVDEETGEAAIVEIGVKVSLIRDDDDSSGNVKYHFDLDPLIQPAASTLHLDMADQIDKLLIESKS